MKLEHRCQNCFLTHLRKYLKTSCFKKGTIFYLFSDFDLKCLLTLYNDLSAGLPKVHLALLGEHFAHWKICFGENTFSDVFLFGSTVFQNVCEKFRAKLLEIPSRCRDDSVELFCFKKFLYFNFCLTFNGKNFDIPKIVPVKLAIDFSRRKCFWIYFLWKSKSDNSFKTSTRKSSEFRLNLLRMVVKTAFKEFGRRYWWKLLLIKITLKVFHTLTQNLLDFWREISRCFVQINFYVFTGSVSGWGFFKLFFAFYVFSNLELKCLDFAHESSTSLSKLLPKSLEEIADDIFFQERNSLLFFSDFDQNFSWLLTLTFQQGCQNFIWRC